MTVRFRVAARQVALHARDPLLRNSYLILLTTVMMAGAGAVFWIVAARLQSPAHVGVAGSLVSAAEALAVLGQLGMDVVLLRTLQTSDRGSSDIAAGAGVVAAGVGVLAIAYVLALPLLSPRVHDLMTPAWSVVFVVLVIGTAVNQLTDGLFLALDRVLTNLWINGILLGLVKCLLPFVIAGAGAMGLYGSVGLAATVAAVVSLWSMFRALPGKLLRRPSEEFRRSHRFARAGYVASILYLTPQLLFPIMIINELGPAQGAHYFVGFQVVTLLNASVYAVCNSMYAEGARHPERVRAIVRKAGLTLLTCVGAGALLLVLASPLVMSVFGADYRAFGTDNLRVLALGSLGVGMNFWAAVRLRLAQHHGAMMSVQLFTTLLMVSLAVLLVPYGIEGVATAWGLGQLIGGLVGYLVSVTLAPLRDVPADAVPVPSPLAR